MHGGVAGVSGRPLPLCRSNAVVFTDSARLVGHPEVGGRLRPVPKIVAYRLPIARCGQLTYNR